MPVVWWSAPDQNALREVEQLVAPLLKQARQQKPRNPRHVGRQRGRQDVGEVFGALGLDAGDLAQLVGKGPQGVEVFGDEELRILVGDDDEFVAAEERLAFAIIEQVRVVGGVERLDGMLERELRRLREREDRQQDGRPQQPDPIADQEIRIRNQSVNSRLLCHRGASCLKPTGN